MKKILVTGSVAYDLLLGYDGSFAAAIDPAQLENLSMGFVTPRFRKHHGGTGANIAWNLRLLRQDPLLVATVGQDGGPYLALLEERGVSVERVRTLPAHATSTAIIATDSRERQITFYHPGADAAGAWPEDLADDREDLAVAIVSPRDAGVMLRAILWCAQYAVPALFDPGQQILSFSKEEILRAIRASSGVIANEYEWGLLSDKTGLDIAGMLSETPMLIVTLGEHGLAIHTREETITLGGCRAETVVNPTGAGDALRAGFLAGMAAGWELRQCGRLGASLASFVVEQEGTLLDTVDLDAVTARAERTYGESLPPLP